jgi:hypothetical protein
LLAIANFIQEKIFLKNDVVNKENSDVEVFYSVPLYGISIQTQKIYNEFKNCIHGET